MSAGHVHTRASLILAGGFIVGGVITGSPTALLHALGSLIGVMISPDQDVDNGNISNKYLRTKIGRWADLIWRGIWYMYRRSLKHGGELSHFPLISTIGRMIYLFCLLIVLPHVLIYFLFSPNWDLWYVLGWYMRITLEGYNVFLGLVGADLIHYVLDISTKEKA